MNAGSAMGPDEKRASNVAKLTELRAHAEEIERLAPSDTPDLSEIADRKERLRIARGFEQDKLHHSHLRSINLLMQVAVATDSALVDLQERVARLEESQ